MQYFDFSSSISLKKYQVNNMGLDLAVKTHIIYNAITPSIYLYLKFRKLSIFRISGFLWGKCNYICDKV
jgi:hypothetical protein